MLRVSVIAAVAFSVLGTDLSGQAVPVEGDRIRIRRLDGTAVRGIYLSGSADEIVLRPVLGRPAPVIPAAQVALIERSLGRHTRFWRNFGLSYGATVLLTGTAVALTWEPCTNFCSDFDRNQGTAALFYGGLVGSVFGLMVGTIVGSAVEYERWEPLTMPGSNGPALSIAPELRADRFGFSASLALGR